MKEHEMNEIMDKIEALKKDNDKLLAAYSLNLCMVSISQIVQYNDINIMEQEYETILNNLNLENIAKDEVLLDVIKQILNVITFFRIQDGDKKFIEKEYKQKMKNAIWSAIPSPVIAMPINPAGMIFSIASMVGTGYMNYRKAKAANSLEYEKEMWKLQRAAIEQLNGLRREMFNASWKFAEHYAYPDELRLTEHQIKQYNEVLTDSNPVRKFEKLWYLKDKFYAYPSFWYFLGNSANEIYMLTDPNILEAREEGKFSEVDFKKIDQMVENEIPRDQYKEIAKKCFEIYWTINEKPLLREDQIACSCALEYAELLDENNEIKEQLDKAFKYGSNLYDVIQLCAIGYIRIGETQKAIDALNILVNAEYNVEVNLQLLSGQMISLYRYNEEENIHADHTLLYCRVDSKYKKAIIGWPIKGNDTQDDFLQYQKDNIKKKYALLLDQVRKKYYLLFAKLLPGANPDEQYPDSYYISDKRTRDMKNLDSKKSKQDLFRNCIHETAIAFDYLSLCNDMFELLSNFSEIPDNTLEDARKKLRDYIHNNADDLMQIQKACIERKFTYNEFELFRKVVLNDKHEDDNYDIYTEIFNDIKEVVEGSLDKRIERLDNISRIETEIFRLCEKYSFTIPVIYEYNESNKESNDNIYIDSFPIELLGEDAQKQSVEMDKREKMLDAISASLQSLEDDSFKLLIQNGYHFKRYTKKRRISDRDTEGLLAVLNDRKIKYDILFYEKFIGCVCDGKLETKILYREVTYDKTENKIIFYPKAINPGRKIKSYRNDEKKLEVLGELIEKLNEITIEYEEKLK